MLKFAKFTVLALTAMLSTTASMAWGADTADEYARLEAKARLFYDNAEWQNASAMYMRMLGTRMHDASLYGHAIVTRAMLGDSVQTMTLLERSMAANVPTDSVLMAVKRLSIAAGRSDLYADILLDAKDHFTWLSRSINGYLLRYYDWRNNGPELVRYATIMLDGRPGDLAFTRQLARGEMLCGHTARALQLWRELLNQHPDDVPTLLDLGNCLLADGHPDEALPYLKRANSLRPTPYLAATIKSITGH